MACPCTEETVNSFCAMLPPEDRRKLCECAKVVDFKAKDRPTVASIADSVIILREGAISANVVLDDSGEEVASFIAVPGDVANIMRIAGDTQEFREDFNEADYGYVIVPSRGCAVSLKDMRELLGNKTIASAVVSRLTDCYKRALFRMYQTNYSKAEDRVRWLIERLDEIGVGSTLLSHEEMARILGMNRVTVTKTLQKIF